MTQLNMLVEGITVDTSRVDITHQIFHWHHTECSYDTNMDGDDYHTYPKGAQSYGQIQVAPIQSSSIYQAKSVCEDRFTTLVG